MLALGVTGCSDGEDGNGVAEASGILDPTFDGDGIVLHDGAVGENSANYGYDLTIDAAGRILVGGYGLTSGAASYDMVIWRYNADGTLDTSFGVDGIVVHDGAAGGSSYDYGYALTIDEAGRVLVSGKSDRDMVIWRYR
jgi:uncharacterized delta-60 repeat protein